MEHFKDLVHEPAFKNGVRVRCQRDGSSECVEVAKFLALMSTKLMVEVSSFPPPHPGSGSIRFHPGGQSGAGVWVSGGSARIVDF